MLVLGRIGIVSWVLLITQQSPMPCICQDASVVVNFEQNALNAWRDYFHAISKLSLKFDFKVEMEIVPHGSESYKNFHMAKKKTNGILLISNHSGNVDGDGSFIDDQL